MKVLAFLFALIVFSPIVLAETVLLDFTADWCPPCQQMAPVVAELERQGYRVERVIVDRDRVRASQFRVANIPTFVVLKDGRESTRLVGACPAESLRRMLGPVDSARAQTSQTQSTAAASVTGSPATKQDDAPGNELIQRSVRITVDDANLRAFGTGTVIRSVPGEALVLTCAHLFEGVPASAKTIVECFGTAQPLRVPGEIVARDREADVALIRVRTSQVLPVAPLACRRAPPMAEARTRSVGCDNGRPPSVRSMRITAVNRYLGAPTIECSGQPDQGRSGGGLFNESGELIGVCSAADQAEHKGIYAGLAAIHTLLDRQGLASLYDSPSARGQDVAAKTSKVKADELPLGLPAPEQLGLKVGSEHTLLDKNPGAEVICLVRSAAEPQGPAKVVVLNKASPEFLVQLEKERAAQSALAETAMRLPNRPGLRPVFKQPSKGAPPAAGLPDPSKSSQWRPVAKPSIATPSDKSQVLATNP